MARKVHASAEERRWLKVLGTLNEFQARLFVAQKAVELGRGGVSHVARLTGMSRPTITKGIRELAGRGPVQPPAPGRLRSAGAPSGDGRAGRRRVRNGAGDLPGRDVNIII